MGGVVTHITHDGRCWKMSDLLWDCNESEGSGWVDEQEACRDVVVEVDSFTSGR